MLEESYAFSCSGAHVTHSHSVFAWGSIGKKWQVIYGRVSFYILSVVYQRKEVRTNNRIFFSCFGSLPAGGALGTSMLKSGLVSNLVVLTWSRLLKVLVLSWSGLCNDLVSGWWDWLQHYCTLSIYLLEQSMLEHYETQYLASLCAEKWASLSLRANWNLDC